MCPFMQICVANLLEPLVTKIALVRVASWENFTFIRLFDELFAARTIRLILFWLPVVAFCYIFCFHWIVIFKEVFVIVQKRVTKAALF